MITSPKQGTCEQGGLRSRDGWGGRRPSALRELGSTERHHQRARFKLTCNALPLAEGDPIFLSFINEVREIFCAKSHTKHSKEAVARKERSKSGFKASPWMLGFKAGYRPMNLRVN